MLSLEGALSMKTLYTEHVKLHAKGYFEVIQNVVPDFSISTYICTVTSDNTSACKNPK